MDNIKELVERKFYSYNFVLDWGGGLVWACVDPAINVRDCLSGFGAEAMLVRSDPSLKSTYPLFSKPNPVIEKLSIGLREKFDPRQILNPGLMG